MGVEQKIFDVEAYSRTLKENIAIGDCRKLVATFGPGCEDLPENGGFELIVNELVANCAEKNVPDIEIGVYATLDAVSGMYRLIVEDNVTYSPAELQKILKNLHKKVADRQGKTAARVSEGQMGILTVRSILARWNGTLVHSPTPQNGIAAIAQWERKCFLDPLPAPAKK